MRQKGFDVGDKHLRTSIANRIIHVIRMQEIHGKVKRVGKAGKMGNAIVWAIEA